MMPRVSPAHWSVCSPFGLRPANLSTRKSAGDQRTRALGLSRRATAVFLVVALLAGGLSDVVLASPALILDQASYTVLPGQFFDVTVLVDGDLGQPGIQPLTNGLFSYGWELSFPATKAAANKVTVVPELDFWGFPPGASIEIIAGIARAEGNVDLNTAEPYTGAQLATVNLQNFGSPGDSYLLQLALAPHFPTEQLFLDGQGNVLDDLIYFGSARVFVIPEPATCWLFGWGIALAWALRNRMSRRP